MSDGRLWDVGTEAVLSDASIVAIVDEQRGIFHRLQRCNVPQARVRTTVAIPRDLLVAVDRAVRDGLAKSRNDFLAAALHRELRAHRRRTIDAAFAGMATDPDYQREALAMTREMEATDWETLSHGSGSSCVA